MAREGKAAAGISDERVWPETQELCDQSDSLLLQRSLDDLRFVAAYLNRDNETNRVPEGGYISEYHSEQMNAWLTL